MVVLGTDAHKRSHTVVAIDQGGAEIGSVTVAATLEANRSQRRWAVEDCRALSRRLEADLLRREGDAGETIQMVRVRCPHIVVDSVQTFALLDKSG